MLNSLRPIGNIWYNKKDPLKQRERLVVDIMAYKGQPNHGLGKRLCLYAWGLDTVTGRSLFIHPEIKHTACDLSRTFSGGPA